MYIKGSQKRGNKGRKRSLGSEGALQPMNLYYLDVPNIFSNTPEGMDLIYALSKTDDMSIFNSKSVQIIIDEQQGRWLNIDYLAFLLPETLQLICFVYWSNIILPNV